MWRSRSELSSTSLVGVTPALPANARETRGGTEAIQRALHGPASQATDGPLTRVKLVPGEPL